ncbi:MAG: hypothetical protein ACUVX8_18035, partial [Candidatus Zipacnadales bacterium]
PFAGSRRITVDIQNLPLSEALDVLAIAGVASWDSAYLFVSEDSCAFGPATTPVDWVRPAQAPVTLHGGTGTLETITRALTNLSAVPVGYAPELEQLVVSTTPCQEAPLEEVLNQVNGVHLTWTRGFWLSPIDRAAVFGRYANLPPDVREKCVVRHLEQMLRLNREDVRQALAARHREFTAMDPKDRQTQIERYAAEIRAGVEVLNSLSPEVRNKAREAMTVFFEMGLEVYRDLTEEEQLETIPIIEAMGELRR